MATKADFYENYDRFSNEAFESLRGRPAIQTTRRVGELLKSLDIPYSSIEFWNFTRAGAMRLRINYNDYHIFVTANNIQKMIKRLKAHWITY